MQRTGTTSVGDFFKHFGYKTAGWEEAKNSNWGKLYFDGDYNSIFNSESFKQNQVFEDAHWGVDKFYKFLFYKFLKSKFIIFSRDPNKWFDSMVNHSNGKTLGNTFRHSNFYNRESEYYDKILDHHDYESNSIDNLLDLNESHRKHYTQIYTNRNKQAIDFLKAKDPLLERHIHLKLEDNRKWVKLGKYFNIKVSPEFEMHSNKSI